MMEQIIVSGFGGQGVLFVGKLLAHAGMAAGKHVCWIPSYGPEMRGGTANCMLTISDKQITSPIVKTCSLLLAFNEPSLDKFQSSVKPGGRILLDGSAVTRQRPDGFQADWISVPARQLAEKLGKHSLTSMVMVGALMQSLPIVSLHDLQEGLRELMGDKDPARAEENLNAIQFGADWFAKEMQHV